MDRIIYSHEHITIDLSRVKGDPDCRLDCFDETATELAELKQKGVVAIIDVTNRGMGRDIDYIRKAEEKTGIRIVAATGFYKEPFFPPEVERLGVNQLADLLIGEMSDGIGGTGIKAGVIGEIGAGHAAIAPMEEKAFRAAARAQKETGAPILTHTTLGRMGEAQIDLLVSEGVDPGDVVIGHPALKGDADYLLRLLNRGVAINFDTIGKTSYLDEGIQVGMIKAVIENGFGKQILASMDITRRSHLKSRGGAGYAYLIDTFIPRLARAGVPDAALEDLLVHNPATRFEKALK